MSSASGQGLGSLWTKMDPKPDPEIEQPDVQQLAISNKLRLKTILVELATVPLIAPFWRAAVIMQTQPLYPRNQQYYTSAWDALKRIPKLEGGASAYFRGTGARLLETALGGGTSSIWRLTYPLAIIATRQAADIGDQQRRYFQSASDVWKKSRKHEPFALRTLVQGLPASMLSAVVFLVGQAVMGPIISTAAAAVAIFTLGASHGREKPLEDTVAKTLAIGFVEPISVFCSTLAAYPLFTVSARQAVQQLHSHHEHYNDNLRSANQPGIPRKYRNMLDCFKKNNQTRGMESVI